MTEETEKLALRYFEGSASADDLSALDRAIQADSSVAADVMAAAAFDLRLRDAMRPAAVKPIGNRPTSQPVQASRRWILPLASRAWVGGLAAAVLVGIGVWAWIAWSPSPTITAPSTAKRKVPSASYSIAVAAEGLRVERSGVNVAVADASTLSSGDLLCTGDQPATLSIAGEDTTIQVAARSAVCLEASDSGPRIRVDRGAVECEVAPQKPGRSFVVVTADTEARVIGTSLRVSSDGVGSLVQVGHGTVRVTRLKDKATVDVSDGEFVGVGRVASRPAGRDMGEYWSSRVRPAGIDQ